jgi:Ca2+-binding EF-hand superfamily protein
LIQSRDGPDRFGRAGTPSRSTDEYLAAVEKSFKAADRDNDGTLDAKELGSARGRALGVTATTEIASPPSCCLRGLLAAEGCKIGI